MRFASMILGSLFATWAWADGCDMDEVLCCQSAFQLYRVPPQVLALCPPVVSSGQRLRRHSEVASPLVADVIGLPIHRLVLANKGTHDTRNFVRHQWTQELPVGGILTTDFGFEVTSPLFTLLMLANGIARECLAMAAYELCGTFAVYEPSRMVERALADPANAVALRGTDAWRRVEDTKGRPTSLWSRKPLIEIDELHRFVASTKGLRGNRNLAWAAGCIKGVAASPLEVQAAMLLGLRTSQGGRNFCDLRLNHRINFTAGARRLSGKAYCLADIYLEGLAACPIDIECQGGIVHDSTSAALDDSRRSLALQSMGIDVLSVTHDQLYDQRAFDVLCATLAKRLGRATRPRSSEILKKERELRRHLFSDWRRLVA